MSGSICSHIVWYRTSGGLISIFFTRCVWQIIIAPRWNYQILLSLCHSKCCFALSSNSQQHSLTLETSAASKWGGKLLDNGFSDLSQKYSWQHLSLMQTQELLEFVCKSIHCSTVLKKKEYYYRVLSSVQRCIPTRQPLLHLNVTSTFNCALYGFCRSSHIPRYLVASNSNHTTRHSVPGAWTTGHEIKVASGRQKIWTHSGWWILRPFFESSLVQKILQRSITSTCSGLIKRTEQVSACSITC